MFLIYNICLRNIHRPAIESTVRTTPIVPAVEATPFFRETTVQAPAVQQTSTAVSSQIDFEQWGIQPTRQQTTAAPRPPPRNQQQQSTRQQVTSAPVIPDYDDSLTEGLGGPTDEFVDYQDFETGKGNTII